MTILLGARSAAINGLLDKNVGGIIYCPSFLFLMANFLVKVAVFIYKK